MNRHVPARLPALAGLLCALGPGAALAAEGACPAANVASDAALREQWPDLVPRVRDEVLSRHDVDACARISLALALDSTIRVEVALPDGRVASRAGLRQEDVIPVLQALLLVPEHPVANSATAKAAAPASSAKARAPARAPAPAPATDDLSAKAVSPAARASGLGVELSVIGGGRFGDGQVSYGLGAQSFLDVSGWLFGFEGRADRYYALSGAEPEPALELGALAGRRIHFDDITLDVAAGPGFAIKGAMADSSQVVASSDGFPPAQPPPPPPQEPSSGPVPRLLVSVRLGFSPRSVLRTFVGADGTFGPARADGSGPSSPAMPHWTMGLTLGATVGTP